MKAVTFVNGNVRVCEIVDPEPGPSDLLVEMRAAALNGADHYLKLGTYPGQQNASTRPGLEVAGVVVGMGEAAEAAGFGLGDRVMGLTGTAAQAELCVLDHRLARAVPDIMSWSDAGSFTEGFTAAHDGLRTLAGITAGSQVAITGASGGVGVAAVLTSLMLDAVPYAGVRDADRLVDLEKLGAQGYLLDNGPADDVEFDAVLELVSGKYLRDHIRRLAFDSTIVVLGCAAGPGADFNLLKLMARRGRLVGTTLRSRDISQRSAAMHAMCDDLLGRWLSSDLEFPIQASFELDGAADAYEAFGRSGKFGKVVITNY